MNSGTQCIALTKIILIACQLLPLFLTLDINHFNSLSSQSLAIPKCHHTQTDRLSDWPSDHTDNQTVSVYSYLINFVKRQREGRDTGMPLPKGFIPLIRYWVDTNKQMDGWTGEEMNGQADRQTEMDGRQQMEWEEHSRSEDVVNSFSLHLFQLFRLSVIRRVVVLQEYSAVSATATF